MKDPLDTELPMLYLKPGEMFLGNEPTVVSTVLGSCVSVTMYSRRHRLGAICHSLLPVNRQSHRHCSEDCTEGFRYVECSIRKMLDLFTMRKIPPREIEVKVFGGSDMFSFNGAHRTVGAQNVETTLRMLQKKGLRLAVSDVGGQRGRKLLFYTHTGEVLLKRLNEKDLAALEEDHPRGC